jgi:hypothetical protein
VYPDRPCVWTNVYRRLKANGELMEYREKFVPPRDAALQHTSGWANFFLDRDSSARIKAARHAKEAEAKETEAGAIKDQNTDAG